MKFGIFFVFLFSLLITATDASYHNKDTPIKCEEYFRVSMCDECQKEIWNYWSNPSTCGFFINLLMNVMEKVAHTHDDPYNLTPFTEALKETCDAEFSCTHEEAESQWKGIEKKCTNELSTAVDLNANPLSIDTTVSSAYFTFVMIYFGIPDHEFHCLIKSSNGELCGIESYKPLCGWLKENIPDGNFTISFNFKYAYKSDGTRLEIPRELFSCGECPKKGFNIYKNWVKQHPLPDYIVKNIFGSWKELEEFYTCSNENAKMKLRRVLDRLTRRPLHGFN